MNLIRTIPDDLLIEELLVRLALGEDARPLSAEVLRRNIVEKATAAARARYAEECRRLGA